MKMTKAVASVAVAVMVTISAADISTAAEILKADNHEPLSADASWQGGTAPGAEDVALWDGSNTVAQPFTYGLGTDVAWQGLRLTNLVSDVTITNDGHTLSIGAAGMMLDRNSSNILHLYAPLELTEDQTWQKPLWTGGGLNVFGPVSGNRRLTLYRTNFSFHEPTFFSSLHIACPRLNLRTNAAVTGGIFVNPGSDLTLMKPVDTDWSDTFPGRVVTNTGLFSFGRIEGTHLVSVTMKPGDRMLTTAGNDHNGRVEVKDNRLVMDGGEMSVNWLYLKSGSVTQRSGRVSLQFALFSGVGVALADPNRIVSIEGGTLAARRIHIGDATPASYPGIVEISDGEVNVAMAGIPIDSSGIALAAARGENAEYFSSTSADPFGILRVSGGSLRTLQMSFGSMRRSRDASWNVTNGYARVELSGGDVTVGNGGIGPTEVWNRPAAGALPETAQSWYDVILSGGTLGAYGTCTNYARTRLSDAHGGTLFRAADTNGTARTIVQTQPLTGSGGLRKTGAGTLEIAAACTYKGPTIVEAGTLRLVADALWEEGPEETLPQPRAVWQADTLAGAFGADVNTWASTNGTWTFTLTGATGAWPWITPPTIGAEMNGRRTVAFNGTSSAMYLTGNADGPETGATNLTVAVVIRARGAGKGINGNDWRQASGIIGATNPSGNNNWGIGYNSYGRAAAGITCRTGTVNHAVVATAWGAPRNLHDGEAHVLQYVWSGDSNIVMNVDGWRTSQYTAPGLLSNARVRVRHLIGAMDSTTAGTCFHGDIAELRYYRTAFTPEQQRTLGLELARTYGADTAGYLTGEQLIVGSLASTNVSVAAGATLQTASAGTRILPGQVFNGAGTVTGNLIVGDGGVIQSATNAALSVAALTFESGGVCRWPWTPEGTPLAVTAGDLTLPAGEVTVDIGATGEKPTPHGVLLSYTGTLTDNGAVWKIVGGGGSSVVRHDSAAKRFYISTPTGTMISVR